MPSTGFMCEPSTFGYYQAQRNRIEGDKLEDKGGLDTKLWPPLFIYDILQLPGTLATVLRLQSSLSIKSFMTPGTLRGFLLRRKDETGDLLAQETGNSADSIKGMLVFGRGKQNRGTLDEYYGSEFRRRKVPIEIVLQGGMSTVLRAHVWVMRTKTWRNSKVDNDDTAWVAENYIMASARDVGLAPLRVTDDLDDIDEEDKAPEHPSDEFEE